MELLQHPDISILQFWQDLASSYSEAKEKKAKFSEIYTHLILPKCYGCKDLKVVELQLPDMVIRPTW
jgi:hypothetical protein